MKKFNLEDVKENSKIVDINEVCFNPWNPKIKRSKEYEKVKESVRLNGLGMPIVVREIEDDSYKYQVLDGEQRLTAALDLGYDKVWIVNLGQVSDEEAKSKTLWYEMAVPFDKEQLGNLLVDLVGKVELPYTDNEIEVISGVSLISEDDEDFDDEDFEEKSNFTKFSVSMIKEWVNNLKDKIKQIQNDFDCSEGVATYYLMNQINVGEINGEEIAKLSEEESEKQF